MASKAQTALRIELEMLRRAESLVPVLSQDPLMRAMGQVSRSSVLRVALARGLDLIEEERITFPSLPVPATAASLDPEDAVVVFSDDWSELRQTQKSTQKQRFPAPPVPPQRTDPQAAGRRILALHTQGLSLREIAAQLTKEGVPTRRGGGWYASTVRSVLKRMQR